MNTRIVFGGGLVSLTGGSVMHFIDPSNGFTLTIVGAFLSVGSALLMLSADLPKKQGD